MAMQLVGRKCGMTKVFKEDGSIVPVTVIQVEPNLVTQIKTLEKDGYTALQVTTGTRRTSRLTKAQIGHFAKAEVSAGRGLWEVAVENEELNGVTLGSEIKLDIFQVGQKVDVSGISKGKGFAGTVKRHNFATQDATHGNSLSHRVVGSTGQNQTPGRVFKGKKMPGRMGGNARTVQNLEVVQIDEQRHLLLVSGAVPGATGSDVIVKPAKKDGNKKGEK